eukprot:6973126-Prymnesium_polylepis.2
MNARQPEAVSHCARHSNSPLSLRKGHPCPRMHGCGTSVRASARHVLARRCAASESGSTTNVSIMSAAKRQLRQYELVRSRRATSPSCRGLHGCACGRAPWWVWIRGE